MKYMKFERCDDEVTYPCLRKCCWPNGKSNDPYIVLFSNRNEGMVVWSANSGYPVGTYRNGFSPDCFEPYLGKITLG